MATVIHSATKPSVKQRTALVASADGCFRKSVSAALTGLRWSVREANGGAQAWGEAMDCQPQTIIVDSWLPDLDIKEFLREFHVSFPGVDIITNDDGPLKDATPSPFRQEILYALNRAERTDTAVWNAAPPMGDSISEQNGSPSSILPASLENKGRRHLLRVSDAASTCQRSQSCSPSGSPTEGRIPGLVGESAVMLEVSRRIRRVAPLSTPVLIEGPTGSGKEVVAAALHRMSSRCHKPFVAINCAAIPEALLEAELFGHTRGAFTGALQGRTGRIEAANGGTLFLDEIGEMPLSLQAKLLRFVESGELQRVGDNENVKVDVRIISATHQRLRQSSKSGGFRSDLYFRLAVFLIRTPALSERVDDIPVLVHHFMERMGRAKPVKRLDDKAMNLLCAYPWPGNVRELQHVLERASILAGDEPVLSVSEIDFGDEAD
ncbi:sigma-54 dependent transcriptional regulator [Occallatibacter savannae]|uniref:sigma-54 dependent transcriptional regulator n=1 Tax=Occallatibacter savannae TaxID=1002691 RepID=UPI000D694C02|nr:sigma-54 dependent transcriptional regulator [Occallatibacter savannae]